MGFKAEFTVERETKGAVLYREVKDGNDVAIGNGAKVGTWYVRKDAFPPNAIPKNIRLAVEWD